jgi:GntR family transcriptional regulator
MDGNSSIQVSNLPIGAVDPDSPIPLYYQIEEDLRRLISNGKIPPGATLPPEMELHRAYGVGRHTMRMALSRMVADGLISRRAGRGTFVNPQPDRTKFFLDRSFSQLMADMGREPRTQVLDISLSHITESSPDVFADKIGADCLQLARLRFGDEEPIGIQWSTILTEHCPGLDKQDFDHFGLYDILAREYNLTITQIQHAITAAVADAFQADLLQVVVGDPLLIVNTTTFLANHQLFEYTTSYYRADKYEYSTTHVYSL